MGDTTNDPWAQAAGSNGQAGESSQGDRQAAYGSGPSRLFAPATGGAPSLFNASHPVGTERTGIITKAPYDQQRTKLGGPDNGKPLFWPVGQGGPTTDPESGRKVMDTVIEIETEYVMDQDEAVALNREKPYEGGARRVFVGREIEAFMKAIEDANRRGVGLVDDDSMVGKRLTVKRISQRPNPHGGQSIKEHAFRIDNA